MDNVNNNTYTPYDTIGAECSICLQEMIPFQSALTIGACGHMFHKACLDSVQKSKDYCVKCRSVFDTSPLSTLYPPDDNEMESCMTIYNVKALDRISTPSDILSMKFVHAGTIPPSIKRFTKLAQVLVYELKNSDDDDECEDDSPRIPKTPCSIDAIYDCPSMQYLRCTNVHMPSVSPSLRNLTKMTYLCMTGCNVTTLPTKIGELVQLQFLDLSDNSLTSLPESIGQLQALQQLHVNSNQLRSLPSSLSNLTNLEVLNICHNFFEAVPECVKHCTGLRSFNCHATNLKTVPAWLGELMELDDVCLSSNPQLTDIHLDNDVKWTDLDISRTTIKNFEFLLHTPDLQTLCLDKTDLACLPKELLELRQLRQLECSSNRIASIPQGVLPKSLVSLDMSDNRFRGKLPHDLRRLINLIHLNFKNNRLTNINTITTILKNVETVDVSHNALKLVGPEVAKAFPNLVDLNLCYNPLLESVDASMMAMAKLMTVDVTDCPQVRLPIGLVLHDRIRVNIS